MNIIRTQEDFDSFIEEGVVFIKITSPTCGPCRSYKTIFEQFSSENPDVKCCSIDATELPEVPYALGIRAVPTTVVMKNGMERARIGGIQTLDALVSLKNKVI